MNKGMLQRKYTDNRGLLVVVSGPAGVGKGSICRELARTDGGPDVSISETTRPMRPGDEADVTYYYVDREKFESRISEDYYLEWARVYDNYYGTPRARIEEKLEAGTDVILEIDPQGAESIRKNFPSAVTVFIMPPSVTELRARITGRGSETEDQLVKRLSCAKDEIEQAPRYDYIIVNRENSLGRSVSELQAVITAEHLRTSRITAQDSRED